MDRVRELQVAGCDVRDVPDRIIFLERMTVCEHPDFGAVPFRRYSGSSEAVQRTSIARSTLAGRPTPCKGRVNQSLRNAHNF